MFPRRILLRGDRCPPPVGKAMQKVCYKGHMGRSRKANSKNMKPIPLSDGIKNALLGKELLGSARHVRSGRTLPVLPQIQWSQKRASKVRDALHAWLDTGEFEPLLRLLEALPEAISYP